MRRLRAAAPSATWTQSSCNQSIQLWKVTSAKENCVGFLNGRCVAGDRDGKHVGIEVFCCAKQQESFVGAILRQSSSPRYNCTAFIITPSFVSFVRYSRQLGPVDAAASLYLSSTELSPPLEVPRSTSALPIQHGVSTTAVPG